MIPWPLDLIMGLSSEEVLVYLDDLIVFVCSLKNFLLSLKRVVQQLKGPNLWLKQSNCYFGYQEGKYLGQVISRDKVSQDQEKIQAIKVVCSQDPKRNTEVPRSGWLLY